MNIRLPTDIDQTLVSIVQEYFSNLAPVSLSLSNTEVVRLSLRKMVETLAAADEQVAEKLAALDGRGRVASATQNEQAGALIGKDRARGYNSFFLGLVPKLHDRGFDNSRKAPSRSWYNFSAGHGMSSKVQYSASFNRDAKARVELYLDMDKDSNKALFDHLFLEREAIEAQFGGALEWQRLDNNKASRIAVFPRDASIEDDDATLEELQDWMVEQLCGLDRALGQKLDDYPA